MPTLHLRWNSIDSIPAQSDPVQSRVFTIDYFDDRIVIPEKISTTLLNKRIIDDVFGIRRKYSFILRTSDIKINIGFLTSFLNSPFKFVLITDAGYYANEGTSASPVMVPVVMDEKDIRLTVQNIVEEGINLISSKIYRIPSVASGDWAAANGTDEWIGDAIISWSSITHFIEVSVYQSNSSGGTYSLVATVKNDIYYRVAGGASKYYKIAITTLGGISPISSYKQSVD